MRNLHYGSDVVTVDTDVCTAVFEYTLALAKAGTYDVVKIPILLDGEREFSNMLLGPASLLFCTPSPDSSLDLKDEELLEYLARRTRALGPSEGSVMSGPAHDDVVDEVRDDGEW